MKLLMFGSAAVALALAGCGATVKASSPRSVVIFAHGVGQAQTLANSECEKHGRFAQFVRSPESLIYHFDCVL